MISKEEIKRLEFILTLHLNDKGIELWNEIKKDLEILEILKENAILYVNDINKNVKSIQINITTCDYNFNKVEEWLNNEK